MPIPRELFESKISRIRQGIPAADGQEKEPTLIVMSLKRLRELSIKIKPEQIVPAKRWHGGLRFNDADVVASQHNLRYSRRFEIGLNEYYNSGGRRRTEAI